LKTNPQTQDKRGPHGEKKWTETWATSMGGEGDGPPARGKRTPVKAYFGGKRGLFSPPLLKGPEKGNYDRKPGYRGGAPRAGTRLERGNAQRGTTPKTPGEILGGGELVSTRCNSGLAKKCNWSRRGGGRQNPPGFIGKEIRLSAPAMDQKTTQALDQLCKGCCTRNRFSENRRLGPGGP